MTAEDVARAASFGDPVAVAMLQAAGRRVGSMLASVVNFFNPSLIVIGGGVANSPDQLLAAIRETVYRRSLPLATRDLLDPALVARGLAGVIGASSMVVDQLFSRDSLARWLEAGEPSGELDVAADWRTPADAPERPAARPGAAAGRQAADLAAAVLSRTIELGRELDPRLRPATSPRASARTSSAAASAISMSGWRIVVSGGPTQRATGRSSKPTTLRSSGMCSRASRAAW